MEKILQYGLSGMKTCRNVALQRVLVRTNDSPAAGRHKALVRCPLPLEVHVCEIRGITDGMRFRRILSLYLQT